PACGPREGASHQTVKCCSEFVATKREVTSRYTYGHDLAIEASMTLNLSRGFSPILTEIFRGSDSGDAPTSDARDFRATGDSMWSEPRELRSVVEAAERAAAAGDYASAEQHLREAVLLQEARLDPLLPDLANTLNNLGVVCEFTDKPVDAELCYR